MRRSAKGKIRSVTLPWSDGSLSACLWQTGKTAVTSVPELGLTCYGSSESEAVFRLFVNLLRYWRQLKANRSSLSARGCQHLGLLQSWVDSIEKKMVAKDEAVAVPMLPH